MATINTIKFSDMTAGGDLGTNNKTPGLLGGANVLFNNPWTFLAAGTTGDRPIPAPSMYYRLRLNTTLEVYEYYDPTTLTWAQLSGSGTGTVNPGVANDIAFYAANGQAVSPIASAANAVLGSNGSGVPSMLTTLPTGLTIPGATITTSTASLLSGSVAAAPVAGTDLTNKTYVDSLFSTGVASATGTMNQVLVNGVAGVPTSGAITLSLPQDIAIGSTPTFAGMTLSAIPLGGSSGGTGVNNGSRTMTIGGNWSMVGAFTFAGTLTGNTAVTFPTSGTLATTSQLPTGAALTKTDDTNVTLTLGGSPATALLNAASLTLGWTGLLSIIRGGTGVGSVTTTPTALAFAGWDANGNLSSNSFLAAFSTTVTAAGTTTLTVSSSQTQEFTGTTTQTVTLPVVSTLAVGREFYIINNSTGAVTVNSSGGNLVLSLAANTSGIFTSVLNTGTTAASWNASYIVDAGGGVSPGSINQLAWYSATGNVVSGLATANNGVLITSGAGVPSISSTLPTAVQSNITQLGTQSQALNMGTHLINGVVDPVSAQDAATKNYVDTTAGGFPSGTIMLFAQTSAPTGWTKNTSTNNNSAIRVVTGSASTGGTVDFTTAFASQSVTGTTDATTLTTAQVPAHTHTVAPPSGLFLIAPSSGSPAGTASLVWGTLASITSSSAFTGGSHTHTFTGNAINLAVKYVDVIQASKN